MGFETAGWAVFGLILFIAGAVALYKMFVTKEWQFWTSDLPDDFPGRD